MDHKKSSKKLKKKIKKFRDHWNCLVRIVNRRVWGKILIRRFCGGDCQFSSVQIDSHCVWICGSAYPSVSSFWERDKLLPLTAVHCGPSRHFCRHNCFIWPLGVWSSTRVSVCYPVIVSPFTLVLVGTRVEGTWFLFTVCIFSVWTLINFDLFGDLFCRWGKGPIKCPNKWRNRRRIFVEDSLAFWQLPKFRQENSWIVPNKSWGKEKKKP